MADYTFPEERSSKEEVERQLKLISNNALIDSLMQTVGGLLAVLNKNRQIVALNEQLLHRLGVVNLREVLGLRPGEALECRIAGGAPEGCGTTESCASCGAAIAIAASLGTGEPVDEICSITAAGDGAPRDLFFGVHACPVTFEDERFVLLFLRDITRYQELAAMERAFFHDINNVLAALITASDLLLIKNGKSADPMVRNIHLLSRRLAQEVAMQRLLVQRGFAEFKMNREVVALRAVLGELRQMMANHPAGRSKQIEVDNSAGDLKLDTDITLLLKVLGNMVINALEATRQMGSVAIRVFHDESDDHLVFSVWNDAVIPPDVAGHIFQRNFSTKENVGRGLGTYSMKLFGERLLGGRVSFSSEPGAGTTFRFYLPRN